MSTTSEKVGLVSGWFVGLLAIFAALSVRASVDQPDAAQLFGNAYHAGGWISYGTSINAEGKFLQFDASADYLYSPRYAAPIRKIVMETRCSSSSSPTRFLTVMPYVQGVEAPALVATNAVFEGKDKLTVSSFDFGTSVAVDAFRLGMTGGNGNWGVTRLAVIYGTKTDDEDALLREFAQQLPVPENLTLTQLAADALTVSASAVEDAAGYCFELTKLTGLPRTEIREDFTSAPNLSSGWTCDAKTEGLSLSDEDGYADTTAGDKHALKIDKATNPKEGPVELGLLSPVSPEPITEWSFVGRVGTLEYKSNRFAVYGRTAATSTEWVELAKDLAPDKKTSNKLFTGAVDATQDIRQVRFVLTADAGSWTITGLDSLCVVYGGNEERELISAQTNATPTATWQNLATSRYGYRVKALGATEGDKQFKDSAWTEEQTVDLAWADVRLSQPENLSFEASGDKLNLSWTPVAMADHYEVAVALVDDPENPVARLVTRSASASVTITELGDYAVTVTAVSPGGVSTASSSIENCTVMLGKVTGLAVEATAADAISAKWKDVPLAESYQAKLFKVTGEAGTAVSDYSRLADGEWPVGWEHYSYDTELYSGNPKLKYLSSWIKTETYPQPITEVKFSFKSHVSAATLIEEVAKTYIRVEGSADDVKWNEIAAHQVTTAMQTITETIPFENGLRRIRFSVRYVGENPNYTNPNIEFGKVTVSYGEYVRTEVESVGTKECAATYRGLDRTAKYVVVVTPQPSEGSEFEEASAIVDLASEYFRPTGPVSIAGCKGGVYLQNFDSLTNVTKETDSRRVPLENWQFFYGSGEAEKLYYTSGTNSTKGGAYCYSDAERTTDSFMIGTVAVKTTGSSVGLAFVNDTGTSLGAPTLTFTAVRRNEKPGDPYRLEWIVTDGPWSIGTESDGWKSLPLAEGEPEFSVTPDDCRLDPGQVIIFRWRQEKVTGGPMLGLDDIHVEFPVDKSGFMLNLR